MHVTSQIMSSKCINAWFKLSFKCIQMKYKIFMNANKNAHEAMIINIIIKFGLLQYSSYIFPFLLTHNRCLHIAAY